METIALAIRSTSGTEYHIVMDNMYCDNFHKTNSGPQLSGAIIEFESQTTIGLYVRSKSVPLKVFNDNTATHISIIKLD